MGPGPGQNMNQQRGNLGEGREAESGGRLYAEMRLL